jgi:hypothetical protein
MKRDRVSPQDTRSRFIHQHPSAFICVHLRLKKAIMWDEKLMRDRAENPNRQTTSN